MSFALTGSLFSKLSRVSSDSTTPQPKVSVALLRSIIVIFAEGFFNFKDIPKYNPAGPPPITATLDI